MEEKLDDHDYQQIGLGMDIGQKALFLQIMMLQVLTDQEIEKLVLASGLIKGVL